MPTRNIVPRATGEGSIGTTAKRWFNGFFDKIKVDQVTIENNEVSPEVTNTVSLGAALKRWARGHFENITIGHITTVDETGRTNMSPDADDGASLGRPNQRFSAINCSNIFVGSTALGGIVANSHELVPQKDDVMDLGSEFMRWVNGVFNNITSRTLTFETPTVAPGSPGTDKAFLYINNAELHFKDENDNEVQITSAGNVSSTSIPSNEVILFEKNTAVVGYTLLTDQDDKLVFISKGSAAGGQTGGGNHSTGTWTVAGITVDAHTHTVDIYAGNGTGSVLTSNIGSQNIFGDAEGQQDWRYLGGVGSAYVGKRETSANANVNTITSNATWRPAARVFTRQQKI